MSSLQHGESISIEALKAKDTRGIEYLIDLNCSQTTPGIPDIGAVMFPEKPLSKRGDALMTLLYGQLNRLP